MLQAHVLQAIAQATTLFRTNSIATFALANGARLLGRGFLINLVQPIVEEIAAHPLLEFEVRTDGQGDTWITHAREQEKATLQSLFEDEPEYAQTLIVMTSAALRTIFRNIKMVPSYVGCPLLHAHFVCLSCSACREAWSRSGGLD